MLRLKYARHFLALLPVVLSLGIAIVNAPIVAAADIPTFTLSDQEKITAKGGWIDTDLFNSSGQFAGNNSAQLVTDGYLNLSAKEIYFKAIGSNIYVTHYTGFLSTTATFRDSDNRTACYIAIETIGSSGTWVGVNMDTNKKTDGCTKSIQSTVGLYTDTTTGVNLVERAVNDTSASFRGIEVPTCMGTTDGTCLTNREKAINQIENLTCNTTTAQGVADCEEKTKMAACLNMSLSTSVSACMGQDVAKDINNSKFDSITKDTTNEQIQRICKTLKTPAEITQCEDLAKAQRDKLQEEGAKEGTTNVSCSGGALGFLLCPLVLVMDNLNQQMAKNIEGMLKIDMMTNTTSKSALQAIWQLLVGIANLLLVVAFLIVIFSQATSMGLSAYGIKKMLPRIIAAAILINVSFFLCGVLVDIFNIVGGTVKGIIDTGMRAIPDSSSINSGNVVADFAAWITVLSSAMVVLTFAAALGLIAFVLPVIATGAIATLAFFIGIALRQVLIVLLIVVAPIAIAAMILPNTEPLFKKWWSSFLKLLAMYPVIMAIMYGCALVAKIILAGT